MLYNLRLETSNMDEKENDIKKLTADDNANMLRAWLYHCSLYNHYSNLCNMHMYNQFIMQNSYYHMSMINYQRPDINLSFPHMSGHLASNIHVPQVVSVSQGQIYKLGNLTKRFFAESVDFFILLLIKLLVTYVFAIYLDLIDIGAANWEALFTAEISFEATLNMTFELLMLEIIHRVLVFFIEACYTSGRNGIGGATPGKMLFGLRIVSCESIDLIPGEMDKYLIVTGSDIGFHRALLRSFLKNLSLALIFPTFATIVMNPQRRAIYDIVCKTIVVEENN